MADELPKKDIRTIADAPYMATGKLLGLWTGVVRMFDLFPIIRKRLVQVRTEAGANYTLVADDEGKQIDRDHATACTVTIPSTATVAFQRGARIWVMQRGAGVVTIQAALAVTISATPVSRRKIRARWAVVELRCVDANEWVVTGDVVSIA